MTTTLTRQLSFQPSAILNEESRLIRVSFSSEEPVARRAMFQEPWIEILGHSAEEVDLSRLNNGGSVLYNHNRSASEYKVLGVVERAWLEGNRGMADIRLSKRAEVDAIWQDVKDGILRNVSVSYQINERSLVNETDDTYRVTHWTPIEISLVDIPADPTVGVGRSEELPQTQPTHKEEHPMTTTATTKETAPPVEMEQVRNQVIAETRQAETVRRSAIKETFKPFGEEYRTLLDECLDNQDTAPDQARALLLKAIGKGKQPLGGNVVIEVGEGEREKFTRAAEEALAVRAGLAVPKEGSNELRGYTLLELARKSLELQGVNTSRLDKMEIVGRAFTHSSSDFPKLLANNANKSMLKGYTEAPEVFDRFTSVGNLSDFKVHDRLGMSEFGALSEVKEGGEFEHGTLKEYKEQIQLATYGKLFAITRQAIINDDLRAFTDIPRKMGRAARRKVGDLVFNVLTSNPNMADGVALFHANHNNLAGIGGAPSAITVGAARVAMLKQTDISGNAVLNIRPSYFIIPAALEDTVRVLMTSETNPASGNSRVPNPVRGAAEIVVDARLDTASTTAWYLTSDPNTYDTIEVGYLDGNPNPFLDQQEGWTVDGVEFKVRIDAAAKALEWRTLYKNPGA